MNLNTWQWRILIVTLVVFVIMGLFPPWIEASRERGPRPMGYGLIFLGPVIPMFAHSIGAKIDFSRLVVQCLVLGVAAGVGIILTRNQP